jgi:hypothetical protein
MKAYLVISTEYKGVQGYYLVPEDQGKKALEFTNKGDDEAAWEILPELESFEAQGLGPVFHTTKEIHKFARDNSIEIIDELTITYY